MSSYRLRSKISDMTAKTITTTTSFFRWPEEIVSVRFPVSSGPNFAYSTGRPAYVAVDPCWRSCWGLVRPQLPPEGKGTHTLGATRIRIPKIIFILKPHMPGVVNRCQLDMETRGEEMPVHTFGVRSCEAIGSPVKQYSLDRDRTGYKL